MSAAEIDATQAAPKAQSSSSAKRKAAVEEIEVDLQAPEPPSKKARRALKKGKAVPAKPSSDKHKDKDNDDDIHEDGEDGPKKEGKKEGKPRSEHGVWIGNLPFRLTAAELRRWLVDNAGGVIGEASITRVKLPTVKDARGDKRDSRDKDNKDKEKEMPANKGFAYVDFSDLGTKVAAIALSESDLQGRKLLIKDAKSFEGRPAKEKQEDGEGAGDKKEGGAGGAAGAPRTTQQRQESNASRKVFVGNLSFKTTQEDLERNFERCGEIEWAKLATFEDTGKCKGFGWVKFKEPEAAAWAVKGFVKIKERIETEEDFQDASDDDDDENNENNDGEDDDDDVDDKKKTGRKNGAQQQQQAKQFKTRKWWVNRLLGRELKLELAEDDQLRYKKRYGKDARRAAADGAEPKPRAGSNNNNNNKGAGEERRGRAEPKVEMKASSQDINVARLTGAVVQHTGTKVTFD
ncbi:Nucleolar protein 13 [Escovopsis weberi]|uniref:Nucleolar protein 13 n=1 Tax=Escovopsis weberi TaxID=150374 RepID=A0A0M8MZJ7_ESCWE|nr:Nucleolar protein 13 [Escovopsis weberi]